MAAESVNQSAGMLKGLRVVGISVAAVAALLAFPALLVAGKVGVISVLVSCVLCGLPGVFAIIATSRNSTFGSGLLVSSFLRMGVALAAVVVVSRVWPSLGFKDFYLWLALVYLALLGVEAAVISRSLTSGVR